MKMIQAARVHALETETHEVLLLLLYWQIDTFDRACLDFLNRDCLIKKYRIPRDLYANFRVEPVVNLKVNDP